MSRSFVQALFHAYTTTRGDTTHRQCRNHTDVGRNVRHAWTQRLLSSVYVCILSEAITLYGDTLDLRNGQSDTSKISRWASIRAQSATLEDDIKEIFFQGRYAPHDIETCPYSLHYETICPAVAKHFGLIDILEANGYRFDNDIQSSM